MKRLYDYLQLFILLLFVVACSIIEPIKTYDQIRVTTTPIHTSSRDTVIPEQPKPQTSLEPNNFIVTAQPPTQTQITGTSTPSSGKVRKIASGWVVDLVWSEGSDSIYYTLWENEKPGGWVYSISEQTSHRMDYAKLFPTPSPPSTKGVPQEAYDINISPSGNRFLYLIRLYKTPTPPPDPEGGEFWTRTGQAEVWLWENGVVHRIGQLEDCIGRYLWTKDERKIVAVRMDEPSPCKGPAAWLLDISNNTIMPLVKEENYKLIHIDDISPNDRYLLYNANWILHLVDLNTLTSFKLKITTDKILEGLWINENELLVTVIKETGKSQRLDIYNLSSEELNDWINSETIPELSGFLFFDQLISPDQKWLAFTTRDIFGEIKDFWLANLESKP